MKEGGERREAGGRRREAGSCEGGKGCDSSAVSLALVFEKGDKE
jgi:hypothetical protein